MRNTDFKVGQLLVLDSNIAGNTTLAKLDSSASYDVALNEGDIIVILKEYITTSTKKRCFCVLTHMGPVFVFS